MSYHNMYLAQKLSAYRERELEKSLALARLRFDAAGDRRGIPTRVLGIVGEALIALGQKLKDRAEQGADVVSACS